MGSKVIDGTSTTPISTSLLENHSDEDKPESPNTPDRVKLSEDTTTYTNSGHWTSILDGVSWANMPTSIYELTVPQISELKEHLDEIPTSAHAQDDISGDVPGPDLIFGRQRHATKQELLAALPTRNEADQLIANYFESMDTAPSKLLKLLAFFGK